MKSFCRVDRRITDGILWLSKSPPHLHQQGRRFMVGDGLREFAVEMLKHGILELEERRIFHVQCIYRARMEGLSPHDSGFRSFCTP